MEQTKSISKKRLLAVILSLAMVFSLVQGVSLTASAETSGDYEYTVLDDGTVEITGYNGSDTKLIIPSTLGGKTVTSIGDNAFYLCRSLTSVTIGNSVTSIDDCAFYWCTSLTRIVIPDSVTSIGYRAFYYCTSLTSVTIGDSVTSIGEGVFSECTALTSVVIPDSVTSIGYRAFYNTGIYNNEDNWENDVLYIGDYLIEAYGDITGEYQIKDGTKIVADHAFYNCSSLTSITIGNSVESIGDEAFHGCTSLTSVIIPNSVKCIGFSAFRHCSSLTSVTIGNSVESIGAYAFNYTGLYNNVSNWENGVLYIGDYLIAANYGISEVQIKSDTKVIADSGFEYCGLLTSIIIPDSVTSIGYTVFSMCDSLTSIIIPDSVKSIGNHAFECCDSLTSVIIGNSVESIGDYAFYNCYSLTNVFYSGTKEQWEQISIGVDNHYLTNAKVNYNYVICLHKNIVTDNAVAPTCEKTGLTEGSHCKDCGAKIKAQTVVKAKGHSTTVKNKKSATYFAKGYSGDTVCKTCKKVVKKGKAIAKKTLKTPKVKVTKGKKQFSVKYTKVSGATGFEVQYKIGKKTVTKTFSTKKSATKAIKKLKKGKYKVKVRAFVKSGTKKAYSKWTKTKTIKVK